MGATKEKRKHIAIIILSVTGGLILLTAAVFLVYVSIYYHADESGREAMRSDSAVTVSEENGRIVFSPQKAEYGLIFYPGGKVEAEAYAPLMHELARENVLCILVKMPFNLAVFNIDGADGIQSSYPEISHWFIGGHSLGGSMAAVYAEKHENSFDGLILLASYSTSDLRGTSLKVLSVYGSEDRVLNRDKYKANLSNLPDSTREYVIYGGCHAYFGSYGRQSGDGEPTITPDEQRRLTIKWLINQIKTVEDSSTEINFCRAASLVETLP